MNAEWMPINPCKDCPRKPSNCGYPDEHCERKYIEQGKITVLRKLLKYLRDIALITPEAYQSPKSIIIKMLKQLDSK